MKCMYCKYHKVVPDPNIDSWLESEDVALVCTGTPIEPKESDQVKRYGYKPIERRLVKNFMIRTEGINAPEWCPLKKLQRDEVLNKILNK